MKRDLNLIASRLMNQPLLIVPARAEIVQSVVASRVGQAPMVDLARVDVPPPVRAFVDDDDDDEVFAAPPPYRMVAEGVALVSVIGETVNRGSWIDAYSGVTSYSSLSTALLAARDDPAVTRGIVLEVDSPGGEAAGCMETGALVRAVDAVKPVVAWVDGQACSAGYAIASGARRVVVAPSATLGSIGVVLLHVDRSEQMAKQGLKPTLIQKGAYKTDGTSVAPLDAGAKARIDALLEVLYGLFVGSVARMRPGLTEDAVRATEAGVYIGAGAVSAGLADAVGTLQDAIDSLPKAGGDAPTAPRPGVLMSETAPAPQASVPQTGAPVLAPAAPTAPAVDAGAAMRDRIRSILSHSEAAGRGTLAEHIAYNTDMTVEQAAGMLAASPKSAPAAPAAPAAPPVALAPNAAQPGAGLMAEMSAMRHPALGPAAAAGADGPAAGPAGAPPKPLESMSAAEREQWEFQDGQRTARELLGKQPGEKPRSWIDQVTEKAR